MTKNLLLGILLSAHLLIVLSAPLVDEQKVCAEGEPLVGKCTEGEPLCRGRAISEAKSRPFGSSGCYEIMIRKNTRFLHKGIA